MDRKLTVYPAIFTKYNDDGEYYVVDFIDLKNCTTEGKNIQEAFDMAQEAMGLFLDDLTNFPAPTVDISSIKLQENQFVSFVSIDMNEYKKKYSNKAVKKTLTIPEWLNAIAEKNNINFSQVLQEALKKKLDIDY